MIVSGRCIDTFASSCAFFGHCPRAHLHSLVHVHRLAAKVKETLKRVSCLYEYVLVINHSRSRDTKLGEKKARRFVSYSRSFLDSLLSFLPPVQDTQRPAAAGHVTRAAAAAAIYLVRFTFCHSGYSGVRHILIGIGIR